MGCGRAIVRRRVVALLLVLPLGGCDGPGVVRARLWSLESLPAGFYPERDDPVLAIPWLDDRPSFGVAISGGGTRSAAAAIGQLRALKHIGWLDRAQYLTSSSGGSWTTVPFTFLPDRISDGTFLGRYVAPDEITERSLRMAPKDSIVRAVSQAEFYWPFFWELLRFRGVD